MAHMLDNATSTPENHGLKFTADEWNGSISNGVSFDVGWNRSLQDEAAELNVYKVSYPKDGVVSYEFAQNLTGQMQNNHISWTPDHLGNELYALWLTAGDEDSPDSWAISPPWKPDNEAKSSHFLQWAGPIGIPLVAVIGLYAIGVLTCFTYRRRKKKRERDKQQDGQRNGLHNINLEAGHSAERHPSVSSVVTVHAVEYPDGTRKPGVYIFTNSPATTTVDVDVVPEMPQMPERVRKASTATSSTASSTTLRADSAHSELLPSPKAAVARQTDKLGVAL